MSQAPDSYYAAGIAITCGFEVSGDPYTGVSGNLDGMGISCGALQWNIGQHSLQAMVAAVSEAVVHKAMPVYGNDLITACKPATSTAAGLAIVNAWQPGNKLPKAVAVELKAFFGTPEMRAQQDIRIRKVSDLAWSNAVAWLAAAGRTGTPDIRLYCWFFDIITQNGSLGPVTYGDVHGFITQNTPAKACDAVCDYLAATTGNDGFIKDAHKNAALWRGTPNGEKLELLVASYLRSKTAVLKYRPLVVNRKGGVAVGKGWINGQLYDFGSRGL